MSENLAQMVKDGQPEETVFQTSELDVPEVEVAPPDGDPISTIEIGPLIDWFDANVDNFPNIKKPTVSIQGVDPSEQLIMTVLLSNEGGIEKRKLMVFDDADMMPVLNLPAMDMQIYNNGFRVIYDLGMGNFVKSYGVRTGLVSVFCHDIDDLLIPHAVIRAKKKDTTIDIVNGNSDDVRGALAQSLDFESLQLRYKQSSKAEGLTTNLDAVRWLLERQTDITDVNHHLQIDNVIIDTLS